MVLFEDFDNVFCGRVSVSNDLSFDCIINCVSGIEQSSCVFLAITANDINKIDSAMGVKNEDGIASRPGRIDEVIEIGFMDESCREKTAINILGRSNVDNIVDEGNNMTAAQFVALCSKTAIEQDNKEYINA